MGSHYSTYIGPYIKLIKVPTEVVKDVRNINTCSNEKCTEHGRIRNGKFCIECSSPVIAKELVTYSDKQLDIPTIMQKFGNVDLFFHLNRGPVNVLIPNAVPKVLDDYFQFVDSDTGIKEIILPDTDKAIFALNEGYKDFIPKLRENGIEFVIKCGIVNYYY